MLQPTGKQSATRLQDHYQGGFHNPGYNHGEVESTTAHPDNKAALLPIWLLLSLQVGATRQLDSNSEALVTTASLGTRKERTAFQEAVADVMRQTQCVKDWRADFMPCHADPCLQVADYCAWAIQRKWESGGKDVRSYNLIKDRITYEFDLWSKGTMHQY